MNTKDGKINNIKYKSTLGHRELINYMTEGTKKMENENEFVENVEVVCTGITLQMYSAEEIKKIRWTTDKGDITWKPKVDKEKFVDGLKLVEKVAMKTVDIPKKLKEMSKVIQEKGSVKLKVCYSVYSKTVDDEEQLYRFIMSPKTFDKWEIV